jgi:hypothetical protein
MTYAQLGACRQWVNWVADILPESPNPDAIDACWRRQGVTAGLEHLIQDGFVGRKTQLEALAKAATFGGCKVPMVFVEGVGGVGKSSLLGKFLTQLTTIPSRHALISYLTFEDRALRVDDPASLMLEVIGQFKSQGAPDAQSALAYAQRRVDHYFDLIRGFSDWSSPTPDRRERLTDLLETTRAMWSAVSESIAEAARLTSDGKFVAIIVIDTWELVSRRASEAMEGFWEMVRGVSASGWVRFVLAGRDSHGLITRLSKRLTLKALSNTDANRLLRKWGVPWGAVGKLTKRYGTSPLTLRLISSIAKSGAVADQLLTGNAIDRRLVQGFLYKRILDRIDDRDVRALAHPGMVVRRVEADLVQRVLAPICLERSIDTEEAEQLVARLTEERGLMGTDRAGRLVFRPELRRSVLALLKEDRPELVARLHEAASEYYVGRGMGLDDLAEELYHRFMLGGSQFEAIEYRWNSEVGPLLLTDIDDMPKESVAWLSARLNLRINRRAFAQIDTAVWERDVAIKVRQALSRLNTSEARRLLREREDRTSRSPLFALEVKSHLLDDQFSAAHKAATVGLERLRDSFEPWRSGELLWLRSQASVGMARAERADADLQTAAERLEHPTMPIAKMHALSQRIGLRQAFPRPSWENTFGITHELAALTEKVGESAPHFAVGLLRRVYAQLLADFPAAAAQIARYDGGASFDATVSIKALKGENLVGLELFQGRSGGGPGGVGPGGGPEGSSPYYERAFTPSSPLVA